jgi:molybdopterin converting factor small subunit
MKPGHGEVLLKEGDPAVPDELHALRAEFTRQIDEGLWAAVPTDGPNGRREAQMVRSFDEVPVDADRVIFFPRAAGGC